MAQSSRIFFRHCLQLQLTKPVRWNVYRNAHIRILSSGIDCRIQPLNTAEDDFRQSYALRIPVKHYATRPENTRNPENTGKPERPVEKKLGIVQRFKQMYRDYWYVLLPVHMLNCTIWFGTFYYTLRSGVDILGFLESLGVSESLLSPVKEYGSAGYFALALALYKLVTPLRYAVTLAGTTFAIRRLTALGWIRPVPSSKRLKEMYKEKKEDLQDSFHGCKTHYQTQMKEKKNQYMDEVKRYKIELQNLKNKMKKM